MNIDRALIIDKPWIDMILSGVKTWEMRTRKTNIRGTIGLIEKGSGYIVGKANLVASLPKLNQAEYFEFTDKHGITREHNKAHPLSMPNIWRFPWVLVDIERYEKPVSYKHPYGAVVWVKF